MVRFVNKNLKGHKKVNNELILDLMDIEILRNFIELIYLHLNDYGYKNHNDIQIKKSLKVQIGTDKIELIGSDQFPFVSSLFLIIEIIIDNYLKDPNLNRFEPNYFKEFIDDINDFFLIKKVPLQIKFLQGGKFYVEKIIDENTSNQITKTLESFSDTQKVFNDFKDAIKSYSTGNNPESIRKCCISIEDYFCVILGKKSCNSVSSYYNYVSKKLGIPNDLDEKFKGIINYIHKYRSIDNHGRLEHSEVEDIELVNQVIIQFTMTILHYVKSKYEK